MGWARLTWAAAIASLGVAGPAHGLELARQSTIELDRAGAALAPAGDVNGDGIADFISGDPGAIGSDDGPRGRARVIFGARGRLGGRVDRLPGFAITGAKGGDEAGTHVAPAGDMNADGLADVVVTAPNGEEFIRPIPGSRISRGVEGAAYVIFGSPSTAPVDLARLGSRGFVIRGIFDGDAAGAGDVDGDGRGDLIVGNDSDEDAYVILGGPTSNVADVAALGSRGFVLRGASGDLRLGSDVDSAGDFNRDGLGDVVIGVPNSLARRQRADDREPIGPGAAYIVLGARARTSVNLARPGGRVIRIDLPRRQLGSLGSAVAGTGDVDGDGFADVAIGAPWFPIRFTRDFRVGPGATLVIFGGSRSGRMRIGDPATRALRIDGARRNGLFGARLAGAGDVNADGRADLLVGAPGAEEDKLDARGRPGSAYLVYGRSTGTLSARLIERSGVGGFAMFGTPGDSAGVGLAAPGDVDGDGHSDILVAAPATCAGATRMDQQFDHPGVDLPGRGTIWGLEPSAIRAPDPARTGAQPDRVAGGPGRDLIRGFGGADVMVGRGDADCLFGDNGDDRLAGGAGGDALFGRRGADRISGGSASDYLDGGGGEDRLSGGGGVDELRGGARRDRLSGGSGGDRLLGGGSADTIFGGAGADELEGERGRDRLYGGTGADGLDGGRGGDVLSGGAGHDYVYSRGGGADVVRCGAGRDRVVADRSDRLVGCEIRSLPRRRR